MAVPNREDAKSAAVMPRERSALRDQNQSLR